MHFLGIKLGEVGVQVIFKETVMGLGLVWESGVPQGGGRSLRSFGVTQSGRKVLGMGVVGKGVGNGGLLCCRCSGGAFGTPPRWGRRLR